MAQLQHLLDEKLEGHCYCGIIHFHYSTTKVTSADLRCKRIAVTLELA